jgi:hypothetical protein
VDMDADIKVYCDAHDKGATYVLPCQHLQRGERIHVHVLAIVNPILGLSWLEFTTGTDDIQRIRLPNITYYVSLLNPCCMYHQAHMIQISPHAPICRFAPPCICPSSSFR